MDEQLNFIEEDVISVEVSMFEDEYVYDIEVDNENHNFFANDILVHNSIYFKSKSESLIGQLREGQEMKDMLNERYHDFAKQYGSDNSTLDMEFEKIFKNLLFVGKRDDATKGAKKKYAYNLSWEEGKKVTDELSYKGFAVKRSDYPLISRMAQKKILELVLNGGTREEAVKYLKDLDKKIRTGIIKPEEYSFPKGISRHLKDYVTVGPVVRAAKYSNKFLGTNITKGAKPKWLYIRSVPRGYPETNVICFEDDFPAGFTPDYNLNLKNLFDNKLKPIFATVGWKWELLNSEIKTLDEFMGD